MYIYIGLTRFWSQVLDRFPVVIRTGKGYVEACLKDVNKGVMAERFVDIVQGGASAATAAAAAAPAPTSLVPGLGSFGGWGASREGAGAPPPRYMYR